MSKVKGEKQTKVPPLHAALNDVEKKRIHRIIDEDPLASHELLAPVKAQTILVRNDLVPDMPFQGWGEGECPQLHQFILIKKPRRILLKDITSGVSIEEHGRVVYIPLCFKDKLGSVYYWIGIKGAGLTKPWREALQVGDKKTFIVSPGYQRGLTNLNDETLDFETSSNLTWGGVRVPVPLAIIALDEFITAKGKKIKKEHFIKKEKLTGKSTSPVLACRGFRDPHRIRELKKLSTTSDSKDAVRKVISFAKRVAAAELSNGPLSFDEYPITDEDYLNWFATLSGSNLAELHNFNVTHNYIHDQNITLAAELVDWYTSTRHTEKNQHFQDWRTHDFNSVLEHVGTLQLILGLKGKQFEEAYHESYREKYKE